MNNFYFHSFISAVERGEERSENIHAYYKGVLQGIWCYSWMKDGVSYVGTTGRTLDSVKEEAKKEYLGLCKKWGITPNE